MLVTSGWLTQCKIVKIESNAIHELVDTSFSDASISDRSETVVPIENIFSWEALSVKGS